MGTFRLSVFFIDTQKIQLPLAHTSDFRHSWVKGCPRGITNSLLTFQELDNLFKIKGLWADSWPFDCHSIGVFQCLD
jgi:hypothetical protein